MSSARAGCSTPGVSVAIAAAVPTTAWAQTATSKSVPASFSTMTSVATAASGTTINAMMTNQARVAIRSGSRQRRRNSTAPAAYTRVTATSRNASHPGSSTSFSGAATRQPSTWAMITIGMPRRPNSTRKPKASPAGGKNIPASDAAR
jgi:hypothetical protein